MSHAVAREMVRIIETSLQEREHVSIALAGGSTPKMLYGLLASEAYASSIPWDRVLLFWGDERYVSHDHEKSNYRMTREALLDHVPLNPEHIFPIPTSATNPNDAARDYAATLKKRLVTCGNRLDITLLGMGDDGHTASLFPGTSSLEEQELLAVTSHAPVEPIQRITLTFPALNNSRTVFFLVAGNNKADALDCVLGQPSSISSCPAGAIQPADGTLVWWVDVAAAERFDVETVY